MNKRLEAIPHFETEVQEREYWASRDSSPHLDWSLASRAALPNLKPTT